jgi:voltage-gated potassium channel
MTRLMWFIRWKMLNRKTRASILACLLLVGLFAVSTLGFWELESNQKLSLGDSFWLSFVTMTTVGYGDIAPKTVPGRLFAMLVTMSCGIGIMAYMLTMLATTVIEREAKRMKGLRKVKFSDHVLIINCPNEDKTLALIKKIREGAPNLPIVLISGDLTECPDALVDLPSFEFVHGNPLLGRVLDRANASNAAQAIIMARDTTDSHSDGVTTQVAIKLETMCRLKGREIYTVAEVVSEDSIDPLHAAGVEDVICIETVVPPLLAQALIKFRETL